MPLHGVEMKQYASLYWPAHPPIFEHRRLLSPTHMSETIITTQPYLVAGPLACLDKQVVTILATCLPRFNPHASIQ